MLVALTAAGLEIRSANATECVVIFVYSPAGSLATGSHRLLGHDYWGPPDQRREPKIMGAAAVAIAIVPSMGLFVHVA
jgi:hypothetical protein